MLNCTAMLLAATVALGQADGEDAFKSYSEAVVGGTWTTTGENGKIQNSYRWIANERFLELTAKGGLMPLVAVIGVDPETKKCTWWIYNEDGSVGKDVLTQEADRVWLLEGTADGPKGATRFKGRVTQLDANTIKLESIEFVLNGENQKLETLIWTRKAEKLSGSASKLAEPAENLLTEFGDLIVGRWIGDVTLIADLPGIGKKGDKVVAHGTGRRIADRRGLEEEYFTGQGTNTNLYFWDPAVKRIRQYGIDSGGTTADYEIWKQDGRWVFKGGGHLADGSRIEGKGTIVGKDDGNTVVYEGVFTVTGEKAFDLHDVYHRASK